MMVVVYDYLQKLTACRNSCREKYNLSMTRVMRSYTKALALPQQNSWEHRLLYLQNGTRNFLLFLPSSLGNVFVSNSTCFVLFLEYFFTFGSLAASTNL